MKKYVIQLKNRYNWEDLKIYLDLDLCEKMFFRLRVLGLNVRIVEVIKI